MPGTPSVPASSRARVVGAAVPGDGERKRSHSVRRERDVFAPAGVAFPLDDGLAVALGNDGRTGRVAAVGLVGDRAGRDVDALDMPGSVGAVAPPGALATRDEHQLG